LKAQPGDFVVLYRPVKRRWPRPRPARALAQIIKAHGRHDDLRVETYLEVTEATEVILALPPRAALAK
jgi:hypothetical protein